jgi:hypothetical protein
MARRPQGLPGAQNVSAIIFVSATTFCCKYVTDFVNPHIGAETNAVRGCGSNRHSHRDRGDTVADLNLQSTPRPGPAPAAVRHADFLLIGGGQAAATAAETLRQEGAEGSIAIVCDEREPPYHRPPLSSRFLQSGAMPPFPGVLDAVFHRDNDVILLKGVCALALDCAPRAGAIPTAAPGATISC